MTLTAKDLALRSKGLGASELAAALGLSPYRTPLDVWADKLGIGPKREQTDAMTLGILMEPVIVGMYSARIAPATAWTRGTIRHPRSSVILATPDATRDDGTALVEAKHAGSRQRKRWGEVGSDSVPDEYHVQVQIQCAVAEMPACDVAVLLDGEFRTYRVLAHEKLISSLIEQGERWWRDHVVANVMPEIGADDRAREVLLSMFPRESLPLSPWTGAARSLATELAVAKVERKAIEKRESELANRLCAEIGEGAGFDGDGAKATWKANAKGSPDWKAIATQLGATPDVIAQHMRPPPRVLRLSGFTAEEE